MSETERKARCFDKIRELVDGPTSTIMLGDALCDILEKYDEDEEAEAKKGSNE